MANRNNKVYILSSTDYLIDIAYNKSSQQYEHNQYSRDFTYILTHILINLIMCAKISHTYTTNNVKSRNEDFHRFLPPIAHFFSSLSCLTYLLYWYSYPGGGFLNSFKASSFSDCAFHKASTGKETICVVNKSCPSCL